MRVRVSETYDLSTQVNKMGIVGIHTPPTTVLTSLWSGFFKNFRYVRFESCDVEMACASLLPADPLQVGVEAGDIAPQDMFNPILYKAVSNESYSKFVNMMMKSFPPGGTYVNPPGINGGSVDSINSPVFDSEDQFGMYYALLANPDGWRKAMPQAGLSMHGLYPLVFSVVSNMGNNVTIDSMDAIVSYVDNAPGGSYNTGAEGQSILAGGNVNWSSVFRGPSMRMPRLPTAFGSSTGTSGAAAVVGEAMTTGPVYPQCYVGLIILPPAKLNKLYYRMKVTWTIEFSEPRPDTDIMSDSNLVIASRNLYATDYDTQSGLMTNVSTMVDSEGTTLQKIMTSGV